MEEEWVPYEEERINAIVESMLDYFRRWDNDFETSWDFVEWHLERRLCSESEIVKAKTYALAHWSSSSSSE